jgi:alanine dehydrogenase
LPYARKIAAQGLKGAIAENPLLQGGVNTYAGHITCQPVADSQGKPYRDLKELF